MKSCSHDHNLELGEDAVNHVIDLLKKYGFSILRNDLAIEFTNSKQRFDGFIVRRGKDTAYLAEVKGKELDRFKKWVDKGLYDGYYEIAIPLLYFVWIKENDKIYWHEITNPESFKAIDYAGTQVYLIPTEIIHEVESNDDLLLVICRPAKYLERDITRPLKHAFEKMKRR